MSSAAVVIGTLTFTIFLADLADNKFVIFVLFFPETGFDISCKLSLMETSLRQVTNPVF